MPTLIEKHRIDLKRIPKSEHGRVNEMIAKDYVLERVGKKIGDRVTPANAPTDKILIIEAGTGSGKSVTIPPEVYISFNAKTGRNYITTQPRTVSAIRTVQQDVVKHYPLVIGNNIGFQTSAFTKKPIKGLLYATIGVLLQQMKIMTEEEIINKYACIIIDEAHERSIETDLTMYFLKNLITNNWRDPLCPMVIFMSATLEMDRFLKYYSFDNKFPEVISISGKTYEIECNYLNIDAGNYIWKCLDTVKLIHENDNEPEDYLRDILIFVKGAAEIKKIIDELINYNIELDKKLYPIAFTSPIYKAEGKEYNELEAEISNLKIDGVVPYRKVIVATNVAETSLTIETLGYVIDTGFRNAVEFSPLGYSASMLSNVTQDMAMQRKGRVGRVAPGTWYPIYTKEAFDAMPPSKYPDIITADITPTVLSLAVKDNVFNTDIRLMDEFPGDMLCYALKKLYVMGAITPDLKPTEIGKLMDRFRKLRLENVRMILAGYAHGSNILSLITIAIMTEFKVCGKSYKLRNVNTRFNIPIGDTFIDKLFMFEEFCANLKTADKWCRDNDVSFDTMLQAIEARDSLIDDIITVVGFNPLYNGQNIDPSEYNLTQMSKDVPDIFIDEIKKFKLCILEGYRLNHMVEENDQYRLPSGKYVHPPDFGDIEALPKHVIYSDILAMVTKKFKILYNNYSIMDGWVDVDYTFI